MQAIKLSCTVGQFRPAVKTTLKKMELPRESWLLRWIQPKERDMTQTRMDLHRWLEEIGGEFGWSPVLTEAGDCAFQVDEGVDLLVESHPLIDKHLALTATLGAADQDMPSRMLLACLGLNATFQVDGKFSIGYRPTAKCLTLHSRFAPEAADWNAEAFVLALTHFSLVAAQIAHGLKTGEMYAFGGAASDAQVDAPVAPAAPNYA
ncbi:hypothetical protein CV751_11090 [Achromobacter ruhlandii]|nr:hypothetical protein CV751_11090 [Achromobacter ruhlandii]